MKFFWAKVSREWHEGRTPLDYEGRILLQRYGNERFLLGVLINWEKGAIYRKSHIIGISNTIIQIRLNSAGNIYERTKPTVYLLESEVKEEASMRVAVGELFSETYNWKQASTEALMNGCTIEVPPFEGKASFLLAEKVYKPKKMKPEKNKILKALQSNQKLFMEVFGEMNYQKFIELINN